MFTYCRPSSFLLVPLLFLFVFSYSAQLPTGFIEEQIATGLDPTTMTIAPDGRIFIAEKDGKIRIIENGTLLADPFLQIEVDNYNERGLGGIAFDPDFEANNYFYIYYTVSGGNHNRISRFTANGNYAIPDSEVILFDLDPLSGTIHNGGAMLFGTDGKLYVAVGDGTNAANGQNLSTTHGKILRLNSDGSIPENNPFYNDLDGNNRAIWAYGFRNPYTFAMHPQSGRIFANDVGGQLFEEVNEALAGKNYGWDQVEGFLNGQIAPPDYQEPLHAYDHNTGCAVIGATFYAPEQLQFPPVYHDQYFFADYCEGIIWVLDPADGSIQETFATNIDRPIAIQAAPDGSLYYLERRGIGGGSEADNTSTTNGVLWRISYTGSGAPFVSSHPQDILLPIGEDASFSISASGAPPISYQWRKDGLNIEEGTSATLVIPNVQLIDDGSLYDCLVFNNEGSVTSDPAVLNVTTNTRPTPAIQLPLIDAMYRAGDTIFFAGSAMDVEDGSLTEDHLIWRIDFHHDEHTHPAMSPLTGIYNGFYAIPVVGETDDNVWYRVWLQATDSEGLSQSVYRDIYPIRTVITLNTNPTGLKIRLDGRTITTPYATNSVVGILRSIKAVESQVEGQELFSFIDWENGSINSLLNIIIPEEEINFTANYEGVTIGSGSGLLGAYYDEVEHVFNGDPAFWRIDTTVQFNWGEGSAAPMLIGNNFYSIRWSGQVEPLYSEEYTFYVTSDDGIRLWVDGNLLIDQWVPQSPFETSGTIFLQAGQRYDIRLEYFEDGGGAVCELRWSSLRTPKAIIPKLQLYPTQTILNSDIKDAPLLQIQLFPQPVTTHLSILLQYDVSTRFDARLYDASNKMIWKSIFPHSFPQSLHSINVATLPAGIYYLELINNKHKWVKEVIVK
ncbi:MAG: PQQ-dependent sugar dehydrogenase [Chitinophagales bacterium]|nr:PQQ-dependent sugar dehydrogenase [Chitinophagales bacterium]